MKSTALVTAFSCLILFSGSTTKTKKPNLVFIFSDQQTFDMLCCYGNKQIKTPNLDNLANQEVLFTYCFSNSPICAPFRGLLLSVQQTLYNGTFVNDKPHILKHDENAVDYIPIWLYEGKGYRGVITRDYTFSTQKGATEGSLHSVLFDRKYDPFQINNLFGDPKMAPVKEKLWVLTQQWMIKYNDQFWEQDDFMKAATDKQWNNPPYIRPVDILK